MSLLDRVALALFGDSSDKGSADRELIDELIEAVVEAVEPRVRLRSGYRAKLAEGARLTVAHLRELGRFPLAPIVVSRAAWAVDPYVRAFFGSAGDVTDCIARSHDDWFRLIEAALTDRDPEKARARQAAVSSGTWDARAEWVSSLIEDELVSKEKL